MINDTNLIISAGTGGVFLFIYLLFAFYVTRHGNFYKIRRWKAAIWVSLLSVILPVAIISISIGGTFEMNSPLLKSPNLFFGTYVVNLLQWLKSTIQKLLVFLPCLTPFLFVVTIGTYYQLKWWLDSDDYLDKIWKDPNRNNKSPIQWI